MADLVNTDNAQDELINFINQTKAVLGDAPAQGAAITDFTVTTDLTGVDTGTDMTAAQAAQIEADLASIATKINTILDRLQAHGLIAT